MMTSEEVLCERFAETWHDLRPRDRQQTASRILRSVESSVFNFVRTFVQNSSQTLSENNEVTLTNITDNIGLLITSQFKVFTL